MKEGLSMDYQDQMTQVVVHTVTMVIYHKLYQMVLQPLQVQLLDKIINQEIIM